MGIIATFLAEQYINHREHRSSFSIPTRLKVAWATSCLSLHSEEATHHLSRSHSASVEPKHLTHPNPTPNHSYLQLEAWRHGDVPFTLPLEDSNIQLNFPYRSPST